LKGLFPYSPKPSVVILYVRLHEVIQPFELTIVIGPSSKLMLVQIFIT